MVKFLLLNGTEYIGIHLTLNLAKSKCNEVYCTYYNENPNNFLSYMEEHGICKNVFPVYLKKNDREELKKLICKINPDVIVILPTYENGCRDDNFIDTQTIIETLKVECLETKAVLYASSLHSVCEEEKTPAEKLLLDNVCDLPNVKLIITRLANITDSPYSYGCKLYNKCIAKIPLMLNETKSTRIYGMTIKDAVKLIIYSILKGRSGDIFIRNYISYNLNDEILAFERYYCNTLEGYEYINVPHVILLTDEEKKHAKEKGGTIVINQCQCGDELCLRPIFCYEQLHAWLVDKKILHKPSPYPIFYQKCKPKCNPCETCEEKMRRCRDNRKNGIVECDECDCDELCENEMEMKMVYDKCDDEELCEIRMKCCSEDLCDSEMECEDLCVK